jgi:hypothetical protein
MPRYYKISDEDLRILHEAGVTKPDIAQHYGIKNIETLRMRERRMGLPLRSPGYRRSPMTVEEALLRHKMGAQPEG